MSLAVGFIYIHFLNSHKSYGLEEGIQAHPRAETSASSESSLEMQNPRPQPATALGALRAGPGSCVLTSPPGDSHAN